METGYWLVRMGVALLVGYALGRLHEWRRCRQVVQCAESVMAAQVEKDEERCVRGARGEDKVDE